MNKIRIIILAVLVLSALTGLGIRALMPEEEIDIGRYLAEVAPDMLFEQRGGMPRYFESKEGIIAFNTRDLAPGIKGYAGPIETLVALSTEGRVVGIKLLRHSETPNFVHRMETPEYLGQFVGKMVSEPFVIDDDIDGISRATVSVEALADSVRVSSRLAASKIMGIEVGVSESRAGVASALKPAVYVFMFLLALAAYFVSRRSSKEVVVHRVRDAILLLSVVTIGLWLATPFSVLHVFNLLLWRISTDVLWLAVVGSTLFSFALAGRFYCGWLCPFGALAEFVGRLPLKKWEVPAEIDDKWRNAKYVLLALAILAAIPLARPDLANFETYVTLFSFSGTPLTWALVIAGLAANMKVRRFWCRYLCPVGAIAGLLSRPDKAYVSGSSCPMSNKHNPLIAECIRCNRCYRRPAGGDSGS